MATLGDLAQPKTLSVIATFHIPYNGAGSMYEQHSQIRVAMFGDASKLCLASARALLWRQPDPCCKLSTIFKLASIRDCTCNRSGDNRPNSRYRSKQLAIFMLLEYGFDLIVNLLEPPFNCTDLLKVH
jgi:hypothetical protein